jgi:hypothetical protein
VCRLRATGYGLRLRSRPGCLARNAEPLAANPPELTVRVDHAFAAFTDAAEAQPVVRSMMQLIEIVHDPISEALDALPVRSTQTWLTTVTGKPCPTGDKLSKQFAKWCDEAGLDKQYRASKSPSSNSANMARGLIGS